MKEGKFDSRYEVRVRKGQMDNASADLIRWVGDHTGIVTFLKEAITAATANDQDVEVELSVNKKKFNYKALWKK